MIVNLAKAMEVQVNAVLRAAMRGADAAVRFENVEGRTLDLATGESFSLGQLGRIIGGDRARVDHLRKKLERGDWFASSLPAILEELAAYRNPAAHGETVPREHVVRLRNRLVGVGHKGYLLDLAQVHVRP